MRLRISLALTALVVASACTDTIDGTGENGDEDTGGGGGGRVSIASPTRLCQLLVEECQVLTSSVAQCASTYGALRVSQACADSIEGATCDDIETIQATCLPPCATSKGSCNDDGTLTACVEGVTYTFDCKALCRVNGTTYSGVCGMENPGTGEASTINDCWCQ